MANTQNAPGKIHKAARYSAGAILLLAMICLIYMLLWGRLFPWSPVKLGYRQVSFSKAVVVLPENWELPAELPDIDTIFSDCERFHTLSFKRPVMIILAETQEHAHRFGGTNSAALALETGTVIILVPTKIQANSRKLVDQLKHECSHALLFQNTSLFKAFQIPEWLREGLAIYYGNPRDNYVGESFTKLAVDDGYFFDVLGPYDSLRKVPDSFRNGFRHSEFRCFVEFLADGYDIDTVTRYARDLIQEPKSERPLFRKHFGMDLDVVAREFQREVLTKKWPTR
ncbi:MAG: hypothetical protein GXY07_07220 [Candidatus Hydrogenedentes bacterium]|jgi:hypothetical protein|nr:hypothetical protein [Candidatus Hydrogenedentota bacterium]